MKHIGVECLGTCTRTKFVPSTYLISRALWFFAASTKQQAHNKLVRPAHKFMEYKYQACSLERMQLTDFLKNIEDTISLRGAEINVKPFFHSKLSRRTTKRATAKKANNQALGQPRWKSLSNINRGAAKGCGRQE